VAGLEAGANEYVTKPFDVDELRARVQVGRTVTELQKTVARRMREFEDYLEDAPLGTLVVDQGGSIGFANNRAYSIFGFETGEQVGQPIEILVPAALRERHVELRNGYCQNPQKRLMASRTELDGLRKDGTTVPLAIGLNYCRQGRAVRVVATVMDLAEMRRTDEQLQRFFDLSLRASARGTCCFSSPTV
jgi:PAS domain S-box-containing protein